MNIGKYGKFLCCGLQEDLEYTKGGNRIRTDNTMAKRKTTQTDKQRSTKHYT